jgi:Ca2+-binding EF-hand superfamily protein
MVGMVEHRLVKLFQNDFLNLLEKFRKLDRAKVNTINKREFRATIESSFGIELSDQDFEDFMKSVPTDGPNKVLYLEFMTKFDTDSSSTLFDAASVR